MQHSVYVLPGIPLPRTPVNSSLAAAYGRFWEFIAAVHTVHKRLNTRSIRISCSSLPSRSTRLLGSSDSVSYSGSLTYLSDEGITLQMTAGTLRAQPAQPRPGKGAAGNAHSSVRQTRLPSP